MALEQAGRVFWVWLALGAGFLAGSGAVARASQPDFRLPQGFNVERVAGPPEIRYPMFACFDDSGHLYVAESSGRDLYEELQKQTRFCRVSRLEDSNGDGFFERARIFAGQLVFPMGLAWREGKLYVADPPDLVAFEDRDGDGLADRRTVLLSGFGHTDNGSLHGLTFGPDGWLYLTMGQPDGYHLRRDDGSFLSGKNGALLRCRPDGSGVELVCRGFENLVEVIFLPEGEIVGTDNWFFRPEQGKRDALVHLVEGGLYPFNAHARIETDHFQSGELLPAMSAYPAVALSGLTRIHSPAFPDEYADNAFSAQFNARKIVRHEFTRQGASWGTIDHDFLATDDPDFHPSDVLEDADGSLIVVDTGSWYVQHCPTGRIRKSPAEGGIYRVRHALKERPEDPRGEKLVWESASVEALARRLGDIRPAVRVRACEHLVQRGAASVPALVQAASSSRPRRSRELALWALGRISEKLRVSQLNPADQPNPPGAPATASHLLAVAAEDPAFAPLCARILGRFPSPGAAEALGRWLSSDRVELRLAAAEALAHAGAAESLPLLFQALASERDVFVEHALIYAVFRWANTEALLRALEDSRAMVQRAALILLNQPPHRALPAETVISRMHSENARLREAARRILSHRPEWSDAGIAEVRRLLEHPKESSLHRHGIVDLLLAFEASPEIQSLLARKLSEADLAKDLQTALLAFLSESRLDPFPSAWIDALHQLLAQGDLETQLRVARISLTRRVKPLLEKLSLFSQNPELADELRLEAVRAAIHLQPKPSIEAFEFLLEAAQADQPPAKRLLAAELLSRAEWMDPREDPSRLLPLLEADPLFAPSSLLNFLLKAEGRGLREVLGYLSRRVRQGWQPSPEEQTLIAERFPSDGPELGELWKLASERAASRVERLQEYLPMLAQGDRQRGRQIFVEKAACAACHRVGSEGGLAGPDLTKIGMVRSGPDLLESILFPSASFAQNYETWSVPLTDELELSGVRVVRPDGQVIIRDVSGAEHRLGPGQIQSMRRSSVSLMPEGLLEGLTPQEIRHLLAYLQDLK